MLLHGPSLLTAAINGRTPGKVAVSAASWLLLAGCAHQPPAQPGAPGFWSGLLHGFLSLVALIGSLVLSLRPYAFPNAGFWYDAGYSLGVCLFVILLVLMFAARIGGFITRGH